jgi:serine protease Do
MATRFLHILAFVLMIAISAGVRAAEEPSSDENHFRSSWDWNISEEGSGGSSYLGVDIDDVSADRLSALKLKEEHGAEITMVDQDAPAGKAGLQAHDVIISINGMSVESTAQLRRIIKETPSGRVVNLGISRDGQPLTIKVQLADRHKSMAWEPKNDAEMPKIPPIPSLPDFDLPVSVVIVRSSQRSGLMVENISPQLGEFFGAKGGSGVLVRSVEKGSRGEKAGFHAGDVIVKVNGQSVRDTSDFSHVLRSTSGSSAAVTVVRDRKEQNLTLTLPEKKDSGAVIEESFDEPDLSAATQEVVSQVEEIARMSPAVAQHVEEEIEQQVKEEGGRCHELQKELQNSQQKMRGNQQQLILEMKRVKRQFSGNWADI